MSLFASERPENEQGLESLFAQQHSFISPEMNTFCLWSVFPHLAFTHTQTEPGTVPLRNSGFPERWTADLENAETPDYKLMCQVPKSFSNPFSSLEPGHSSDSKSGLKESSELRTVCLACPWPHSQGFQQ